MLGKTSISKIRGTVQMSTHTVTGYKVLPTYHSRCYLSSVALASRHCNGSYQRQTENPCSLTIQLPQRQIWIRANPGGYL